MNGGVGFWVLGDGGYERAVGADCDREIREQFPRSSSLAGFDGSCGSGLPPDSLLPPRSDAWTGTTDATCSGFSPIKHRRGAGQRALARVPPSPFDGSRIAGGARDAARGRPASRLCLAGTERTASQSDDSGCQTVEVPQKRARAEARRRSQPSNRSKPLPSGPGPQHLAPNTKHLC